MRLCRVHTYPKRGQTRMAHTSPATHERTKTQHTEAHPHMHVIHARQCAVCDAGILHGVSSGVKAFVKESSSGNPVSGGMSLARHITHGLADSAAKLSGSVAKGVGRATLDREYQAARERRQSEVIEQASCSLVCPV